MKKRILSLCMVLALCLSLLPATALAADGDTVYVGGVALTGSTSNFAYATTDESGNVITEGADENNYNIKWDGSTLTLKGAYITGQVNDGTSPIAWAAIGVFSTIGNAELTIQLEDSNTVGASTGVHVFSSTGTATLTINGGGSLDASSISKGIWVQSNSGNASLSIQNTEVTATSAYGQGVTVQAGSANNQGHTATLTVNGGKLTASGAAGAAGIEFDAGGENNTITTTLSVSNNALVDTRDSSIAVFGNNSGLTPTGDGIVFNGNEGTVYGDVTLQENLEIGEDESLTIPDGAGLTVPVDVTLTNKGEVTTTGSGTLTNNGTINNSGTLPDNIQGTAPPRITTTSPLASGTVGTAYSSVTLAASGNPTSWEITEGSLPAGLTLDENTGVISGTPTAQGTSNFTVTATNSGGSDSEQLSITINAQTNVPVTGVSLNTNTLNLIEGDTDTLTATVEPDNATNKNVTWSSDDESVATVNDGVVTAVTTGTATITVTTEGGSKTAVCVVTVTHGSLTHTPGNAATCTREGNEEYWTCDICGKHFSDAGGNAEITLEQTVIPATDHSYGEPVWSWSEDGKSCTVTFICANDETHRATPEVTITSEVKTAASCTEKGVTEYTATAEFDGITYTDTKDVADIPVTDHHYENGRCSVCGAIDSSFKPVITAGAGSTWQKGSRDGLSFTSSAAFADFIKVQVDGRDLAASDYEVRDGSTIVTLNASYLETLPVGDHTLAIISDTGTATTEFTIHAAFATEDHTPSPQTGDNSNMMLLFIFLFISSGTVITLSVGNIKRKKN